MFWIIHVLYGYIGSLYKDSFTYVYLGVFLYAILNVFFTKNKNGSAHKFAAYLSSFDILLRMSGSFLFWEFGKYSLILLFIVGLLSENKSVKTSKTSSSIFLYIICLLPAAIYAWLDITDIEVLRQDLSFNLSGPLTLGVSVFYFYN